jgi:hypothetical protein
MMRWSGFWVVAAYAATVQPTAADPLYYSMPGLCEASDLDLEMSDAVRLIDGSMENHFFGCYWTPAFTEGWQDRFINADATCNSEFGEWSARFEMVSQSDGTLHVFQETGGISPVRFYPCN